jgi:hypothetical protein
MNGPLQKTAESRTFSLTSEPEPLSPESANAIVLRGVTKRFDGAAAVDGLSLTVPR